MSKNNGKKHVSQRQLDANRRNAQKSTGPKTQDGIDHSKFNAIRHGLTADTVCIPGEHLPDFEERRRQYHAYFQPANLVEFDLVDSLNADLWRLRRVINHESSLLLIEVKRRRFENADTTVAEVDPDAEATLATQALANDGHALHLLNRYEARLNHNIHRTVNTLLQLQRLNRPPSDLPYPLYPPAEEPLPPTEPEVSPGPSEPPPSDPAAAQTPLPNEPIPTTGHRPVRSLNRIEIIAARPPKTAFVPPPNTSVTDFQKISKVLTAAS